MLPYVRSVPVGAFKKNALRRHYEQAYTIIMA